MEMERREVKWSKAGGPLALAPMTRAEAVRVAAAQEQPCFS
jgi:hypothetical protein